MKKDLFYTAIFSLSLITLFSLGYFTANIVKLQKPPIVVEKTTDSTNYTQENDFVQPLSGRQGEEVVASVNSDKFHLPDCPGAKSIKEENKIYFKSAEEALKAGFTLAGNCR